MSRFRFRLQILLDLRRRQEEQLQLELAEVMQRVHLETERLEELQRRAEAAMREAAQTRSGTLHAAQADARARYLSHLDEEIALQRDLLDMVRREAESKREELIEAARQTQTLEKLKGRHAEAHRREELREEQKFLDEFAAIRASRANRSTETSPAL